MKWTLAVLCASQLLFTAATHAQLKTTTPELLLDSRIEARTSVTAEAGQDTLLRSRLSTADKKYVSLVVGLAVEGLAKTAAASDLRAAALSPIVAVQDELLRRLADYDIRGIKRYRHIPHLAFTIEASALPALRAEPMVLGIEEDGWYLPTLAQSVELINADNVWDAGFEGRDHAIAILDTGVDKSHSFLSGKVIAEACFSTSDPSLNASSLCPSGQDQEIGAGAGEDCAAAIDGCDHGTHVAGIAAGYSRTFPGVARGADIIAIQVFTRFDDRGNNTPCADDDRPSPCTKSQASDVIAALDWLYGFAQMASPRIKVAAANLSLGGGKFDSTMDCDTSFPSTKAAIDKLRGLAIPTVASAGNDNFDDGIGKPGCISSAISVGATDKSDNIAINPNGSTWGSNSASILSLLAPGVQISSSVPGGAYAAKDGTSMAVPHVTGGIALVREFDPFLSVTDVLDLLQTSGVPITDPRNNVTTSRVDFGAALAPAFIDDGYDDIVYIKGGLNGAEDYRLAVVAGPTPNSGGGITLTHQEQVADDFWLHHWSPGRTLGVTTINDLDGDGTEEIAYLKGGPDGPTDYRLIVVSGPTMANAGGTVLFTQETAPDDHWLHHWSVGRTVGVVALNDLDGDGFQDIGYLKGGPNGPSDYRFIVVSGPTPNSAGGTGITVQETAPDDYWLNAWAPGRTVGVTVVNDIDGDGFQDIAYLKGGPGGPSDYRLIFVSGPTLNSPGGASITVQETAPDDHWLQHWAFSQFATGRTVDVTAINDIDGDGYDEIAYLKGGPNGPTDYRLIVVSGPTPSTAGGQGIHTQENAPDDFWLDHWSPGERTVQIARMRLHAQ